MQRVQTFAGKSEFAKGAQTGGAFRLIARALALSACVSLLALSTAHAQTAETTRADASEPIVVLGTRPTEPNVGYVPSVATTTGPWGARPIEDVPYTLTVLPSALIENTNARSLDQLFIMAPLVQSGQSQDLNNIAQATLRGFNVARAYVNGVQNNNLGMGVFVEEIDQVEVLNGLSGFLYGSSPVGGVINYQLKRPTDYDLRSLTLGNFGGEQYYAHADLGGALGAGSRFGYRLNLLAQDGDTTIDDQSLRRTMTSASVDWRPADDVVVEFFASRKDYRLNGRQFQFFLNGNVPDAIDGSQLYTSRETFLDVDTNEASLTFAYAPSNDWSFRAAYAYKEDTRSMVYALGSLQPGDQDYQFTIYGGRNGARTHGGYAYLDHGFSTGSIDHRLTIGVNGYTYANRLAIQSNGFPSFFTGSYTYALDDRSVVDLDVPDWNLGDSRWVVNGRSRNINAIIGDDITFNDQWSLLAGANFSRIRSENFDFTGLPIPNSSYDETAVTPTVSLLYKPTESITTYLSYMESLEQGAIVGPTYANANQILEPLMSRQYEIGAKARLNGLLLTAALFQIERATERSSDGTSTGTYVQDGLTVHRGLELSATGQLTDELTIITGLTLMDNEIEESANSALEGRTPNWVADQTFKVYGEYAPNALPGWTFSAGAYYTGERFQDAFNTRTIPSYTILDLGVRYETEVLGRDVIARLNVSNADDTRYWAATSPGAPRTVAFSLTTRF